MWVGGWEKGVVGPAYKKGVEQEERRKTMIQSNT